MIGSSFILADGAVTNPKLAGSITSDKLNFGTMEKVSEVTVAGSAVTSVAFTGLDLSADKAYILIGSLNNPTLSNMTIRLYYNSDTTNSHYYMGVLWGGGGSVGNSAGNDASFGDYNAGFSGNFYAVITALPDGKPYANMTEITHTNDCYQNIFGHIRNNTENVTRIDLTASVASSIAIGSKFILFKVSK